MRLRMKKFFFPVLALATACLVPTPARADDDSPLAKQMEVLNDAYKAFRREDDAGKGATLAREAQEAVLKAIPMLPAMVEEMPDGAAKSKAVANYRLQMGQLFASLCEVEVAFVNGEVEKVAEIVKTLKSQKKEGHNQFMEDED